jgi:hypothetical protein
MGWAGHVARMKAAREVHTQFETENLKETGRGLEDNIKTHL